jgi:hypothetical protein
MFQIPRPTPKSVYLIIHLKGISDADSQLQCCFFGDMSSEFPIRGHSNIFLPASMEKENMSMRSE